MQKNLDDFLSENYKNLGKIKKRALLKEITNKFEANVHNGNTLSEEEGKCLLSDGLLGVLQMRCPELKQNEVFTFLVRLNDTIQNLETEYVGHPYSDIKAKIQEHLQDQNANDYNIWKAIQLNYTQNPYWIAEKETGQGGDRTKFIQAIEKCITKQSPLQQKEKELSSLEDKNNEIDAELNIQNEQEGQDIGE